MKFFRSAIILAVVLVVGGGAYWFFDVKRKKDKTEKKEKEALLFAKSDKKVSKLVLKEKGKEPIAIQLKPKAEAKQAGAEETGKAGEGEDKKEAEGAAEKDTEDDEEETEEEDEWLILSPVETGGDAANIKQILASLKEAKREEVVQESLAKEGEYGLQDPDFSVEFSYEGETETHGIAFGVGTLDRKRLFAKLLGGSQVITVPSTLKSALAKTLFDLRDKRIAPYKNDEVAEVTKISVVEAFNLKKEGDAWYFMPEKTKALESRVDLYTGYLRWGSIAEVVEEKGNLKNFRTYGLDKPRLILTFKLKDGGSFLFWLGNPVKQGDAEFYYAARSSDAMIFQVTADTARSLSMTKFQIKDRHIFDLSPQDIVKASFKYGDQDFTVEKEGEEWKFAGAKEFLEKGYSIENTIFALATAEYEDVPPVKKGDPLYKSIGLDATKYTITLYFNDNREPLTFKITDKDQESKAWMTPDDGKTAYRIFSYFMSNLPEKKEELME
jgi:hypothetical protein